MEQQIHFCTTIDGARIAYATVGEGRPLVKAANWLSHLEFDWRSPIWRHLLAEFARDHTFIRYDERGNGLSDWNVADLSFDAWVRDLESVAAAARLDRFPLLGISQGGAVAIAYAVRHPERVSHLILYGAYARGWAKRDSPEEIEQRQAQLTLVRLGWGKDNPAFRQLWTTLYAPDATPEQAQSFNDLQRISTSPENAVKLLNSMGNIDVVDLLPQVKVPTLVLHCRDEAGVPFEEGRLLAATIPNASFVPLNGRNHLLLEGDPSWATFVKEVRRFLGTEITSAQSIASDSQKRVTPIFTRSDLPERYSIISLLGVGGMGEVHLAEDKKLGRKVALKTLPAEFTNDSERLRRFRQEARAASALNHPNILTIHEIGEEGGLHFMATEYIDGKTLRAKLKKGRMKIDRALDIAQQTAFALTAAHGAGIVHRDIKPENIMVRRDDIVKVLDFGLAKLLEDHAREMVDHEADTHAMVLTDPGTVMGTARYMSPEQARGEDLDARTDIWSLGVVLYEMIAGRVPFRGETKSHTVIAILEAEPAPLATFAPDAPAELQRIVRKTLTKDRDLRYQTARDLMIDLKNLRRDLDIQSEMKRSAATGVGGEEPVTGQDEASAEPAATNLIPAHSTQSGSTMTTEQSQDFIARVRQHKRAVIIAAIVLALVLIVTAVYFRIRAPGVTINSIAVLPLVNASNDPNAEYLSDGITESIINTLSQLPNLKVMARTTVFRYKGKETDAQKVGKELGVEAVLTGKVLQRGDTLVIQADLVRVSDGSQLWGEQYTRKMSDIFAVQGEIAKEISERLQLRLTDLEKTRLTKHSTENAEAYELYLKGYHYVYKFDEEDIKKGIEYFKQAIEKDRNYAPAYAGLAEAYFQAENYMNHAEAGSKAKEAAQRALAIDPTVADGHYALALVSIDERDWPTAEREFQQAIKLKPSYALAYDWYGWILAMMGRFDESFANFKRGLEVDPLSLPINADLGQSYYWARRYDQSVEQLRKTLELDPSFPATVNNLAMTYTAQGQYQQAVAELKKVKDLERDPIGMGTLGYVYAKWGKKREAQQILDELKQRSKSSYIPPQPFWQIHLGLGEKDQAFEWLLKGCHTAESGDGNIKVDPMFDELRSDPRYADALRCVGFTP